MSSGGVEAQDVAGRAVRQCAVDLNGVEAAISPRGGSAHNHGRQRRPCHHGALPLSGNAACDLPCLRGSSVGGV